MRTIKFRGTSKKMNKWVYGSLLVDNDEYFICWTFPDCSGNGCERVIPKSVSQFTGLLDKNRKEIYEDVLPFADTSDNMDEYEVIGNIYENPGLLEKK